MFKSQAVSDQRGRQVEEHDDVQSALVETNKQTQSDCNLVVVSVVIAVKTAQRPVKVQATGLAELVTAASHKDVGVDRVELALLRS
jgi:hypothetical protein